MAVAHVLSVLTLATDSGFQELLGLNKTDVCRSVEASVVVTVVVVACLDSTSVDCVGGRGLLLLVLQWCLWLHFLQRLQDVPWHCATLCFAKQLKQRPSFLICSEHFDDQLWWYREWMNACPHNIHTRCLCIPLAPYKPASKTHISFNIASLRSSMVHSSYGCSLAKFLLVSIGNFPSTIVNHKSPWTFQELIGHICGSPQSHRMNEDLLYCWKGLIKLVMPAFVHLQFCRCVQIVPLVG